MGKKRNVYKVLVGNVQGKDHLEDLGIDGTILQLSSNSIFW
jgi:hypothetical protein